MSRQKNSILINEHALNREPVPLISQQRRRQQRGRQKTISLSVLAKQTTMDVHHAFLYIS